MITAGTDLLRISFFFDHDDGSIIHDTLGSLLHLDQAGVAGEAMITRGDSGGGVFIESDGAWLLAGVNSFVSRVAENDVNDSPDGSLGDVGAATRVSSYADWIKAETGMKQVPVANSGEPPLKSDVPLSVTEGQGTWFSIQLGAVADRPCSVEFRTIDGSAVAGFDYIATSGVLNIASGQRWAKIWVQTLADALSDELSETFYLEIFNPQDAMLSGA